MDLHETYLTHRAEIAAQVHEASEAMSQHTEIKQLPSGALIITQPASAVALTPTQVRDLMARIGTQVLS
jgi:hypothetical protein